jgi:hypothetical protein
MLLNPLINQENPMQLNYVYLVCQVLPFDDYRHEIHLAFATEELAEEHKTSLIKRELESGADSEIDVDYYVSKMLVHSQQVS